METLNVHYNEKITLQCGRSYTLVVEENEWWWHSDLLAEGGESETPPGTCTRSLKMEDALFNLNSAVLLPEGIQDQSTALVEQCRLNGLRLIEIILKHSSENSILLAGHSDKSFKDEYNKKLSRLRAMTIHYILKGDDSARKSWQDQFKKKRFDDVRTVVDEDIQLILKWVAETYEWDCDPGDIDGQIGPKTKEKVIIFQKEYNRKFNEHIVVDGIVHKQFWGAVFDLYQDFIAQLKCITVEELKNDYCSQVEWVGSGVVGCGEMWPNDQTAGEEYQQQDRRVEVLFFNSETPAPAIPCMSGSCSGNDCPLYGSNPEIPSLTKEYVNLLDK